jgi:hypothetical protein
MKKILLILAVFISSNSFGEQTTNDLQKVFRFNVISPGFEIELPISVKSTIAANAGIGIQWDIFTFG